MSKHLKHQYCQENCPAHSPSTQSDKEQLEDALLDVIYELLLPNWKKSDMPILEASPAVKEARAKLKHLIAEETNTAYKRGYTDGHNTATTLATTITDYEDTLKADKEQS